MKKFLVLFMMVVIGVTSGCAAIQPSANDQAMAAKYFQPEANAYVGMKWKIQHDTKYNRQIVGNMLVELLIKNNCNLDVNNMKQAKNLANDLTIAIYKNDKLTFNEAAKVVAETSNNCK